MGYVPTGAPDTWISKGAAAKQEAVPKLGALADSCLSSCRKKLQQKGMATEQNPLANGLHLGGRANQASCFGIYLLHALWSRTFPKSCEVEVDVGILSLSLEQSAAVPSS